MIWYIKKYSVLIAALVLLSCSVEDENSPGPEEFFVKYYGDLVQQEAVDLIINEKGNYVMFGTRQAQNQADGRDYYFVEADEFGNTVREKSWNYTANRFVNDTTTVISSTDQIASKIVSVEGGYLIIGSVAFMNASFVPQQERLYVSRLDENFDRLLGAELDLWAYDITKNTFDGFSNNINTSLDVGGKDLIQIADGSVVFVGYSDALDSSNTSNEDGTYGREVLIGNYFIEANSVRKVWRKTLGHNGSDDEAIFIGQTPSNELMVIGSATNRIGKNGSTGANVSCWLLNNIGNISNYSPTYGITGVDRISSNSGTLIQSFEDVPLNVFQESSGFTVVGTSSIGANEYAFMMQINNQAVRLSSGLIHTDFSERTSNPESNISESNVRGYGITRAFDGNMVLVGQIENYRENINEPNELSFNDQMLYINTDQQSSAIAGSAKQFGIQNGSDKAVDVVATSDGRIAVLGTADIGGSATMFSLVKMNIKGELSR
ncbi:MAG: hypothetical protein RIA69_14445 [Cyclobacteriaceae bacterium]